MRSLCLRDTSTNRTRRFQGRFRSTCSEHLWDMFRADRGKRCSS